MPQVHWKRGATIKIRLNLAVLVAVLVSIAFVPIVNSQDCTTASLGITTNDLPPAEVGKQYAARVDASGGKPDYQWSKTGNLPPGLSLVVEDCSKGSAVYHPYAYIKGKPTKQGSYDFKITLSDGSNAASKDFSITVADVAPSVSVVYPNGPEALETNKIYSITWRISYTGQSSASFKTNIKLVQLQGGEYIDKQIIAKDIPSLVQENRYQWTVPSGLEGDNYRILVEISDIQTSSGSATPKDDSDKDFSILSRSNINIPPAINSVPSITEDIVPSQSVSFTWTASDEDNNDLFWDIDWGDGQRDKTDCPSSPGSNKQGWTKTSTHIWAEVGTGAYTVKATVSDCTASTRRESDINIVPLKIDTISLPDAALNQEYAGSISAKGIKPPFTFSATGLPPGISISSSGQLSGRPTTSSTYNPTFTAKNTDNSQAQKQIQLRVAPAGEQRKKIRMSGTITGGSSSLSGVKLDEMDQNVANLIGTSNSNGVLVFRNEWASRLNSEFGQDLINCKPLASNSIVECDALVKPNANFYEFSIRYTKSDNSQVTETKRAVELTSQNPSIYSIDFSKDLGQQAECQPTQKLDCNAADGCLGKKSCESGKWSVTCVKNDQNCGISCGTQGKPCCQNNECTSGIACQNNQCGAPEFKHMYITGQVTRSGSPLKDVEAFEVTGSVDYPIGVSNANGELQFQQEWLNRLRSSQVYDQDLTNCGFVSSTLKNVIRCDAKIKSNADYYNFNVRYEMLDGTSVSQLKKSIVIKDNLFYFMDFGVDIPCTAGTACTGCSGGVCSVAIPGSNPPAPKCVRDSNCNCVNECWGPVQQGNLYRATCLAYTCPSGTQGAGNPYCDQNVDYSIQCGASIIPQAPGTYIGNLEAADCDVIAGWACDTANPNSQISVDIYEGATKLISLTAGNDRPDTTGICNGGTLHGFSTPTPDILKDSTHSITAKYGGYSTPLLLTNTLNFGPCNLPAEASNCPMAQVGTINAGCQLAQPFYSAVYESNQYSCPSANEQCYYCWTGSWTGDNPATPNNKNRCCDGGAATGTEGKVCDEFCKCNPGLDLECNAETKKCTAIPRYPCTTPAFSQEDISTTPYIQVINGKWDIENGAPKLIPNTDVNPVQYYGVAVYKKGTGDYAKSMVTVHFPSAEPGHAAEGK